MATQLHPDHWTLGEDESGFGGVQESKVFMSEKTFGGFTYTEHFLGGVVSLPWARRRLDLSWEEFV